MRLLCNILDLPDNPRTQVGQPNLVITLKIEQMPRITIFLTIFSFLVEPLRHGVFYK